MPKTQMLSYNVAEVRGMQELGSYTQTIGSAADAVELLDGNSYRKCWWVASSLG